jgi:hypothetical protein
METPPVKEISFTDYSGFAPACQVFFLNSLRHFSQQLAKKRELPRSSLLETVKNLRYGGWTEQRGARGGKTRLEYKKPPPEKPGISGFFGNSILPQAKCSAAEAQSKKSGMDFFDKLKRRCRQRLQRLFLLISGDPAARLCRFAISETRG